MSSFYIGESFTCADCRQRYWVKDPEGCQRRAEAQFPDLRWNPQKYVLICPECALRRQRVQ
jgi:hypothetical protein